GMQGPLRTWRGALITSASLFSPAVSHLEWPRSVLEHARGGRGNRSTPPLLHPGCARRPPSTYTWARETVRRSWVPGVVAALALLGAACPSPPDRGAQVSPSRTVGRAGGHAPLYGGHVLFGAEGWPLCLNPITSCAASDWARWTVLER